MRKKSILDRILSEANHGLNSIFPCRRSPVTQNPGDAVLEVGLTPQETRQVSGYMRVNHTGEVCAQALYRGQAFFAKNENTERYLLQAAAEEYDHLLWCQQRLTELESRPSVLNFFWYSASFKMGMVAALFGDRWSYGFVVETEKQVEKHLSEHLAKLPTQDAKSRVILAQMQADEIRHGRAAQDHGGKPLPALVQRLMRCQSRVMTTLAYYI